MENLAINKINSDFWKGKKVFLTGHTGFKGSWISLWLNFMGAQVKGFALEAPTTPALFNEAKISHIIESEIGDIRNANLLSNSIKKFNPDIIIHMAAQPLVRHSYIEPVETFSTNIMGTINVLEASRNCNNLGSIVNITTDKCYANNEWVWGYRETEPMGGYDTYSSSKACSELVTGAYRSSFFQQSKIALATARAGNVIGGGDWAKDRLIPDILNAFENKFPVVIRNPKSIRPWQHVLEPLSGYLLLSEKLYNHGQVFAEAWNFGPNDEDVQTVQWIADKMTDKWGLGANWKLDDKHELHEANYLKLDISKARKRLQWSPKWNLTIAIEKILEWHHEWLEKKDIQSKCISQIKEYQNTNT